MTTAAIDGLFDDYAAFLPEFLEEVLHVQASRPKPELPKGRFLLRNKKRSADNYQKP